jgi:DNA-binding MarR family transcriptional regulator
MEELKFIQEESLGYLMDVGHRKLHKKLIDAFNNSGYNVTPVQWEILVSLHTDGEQYQSQIALSQKKDRASIKRLVDQLLNKGFINRTASDNDERTNILSLTEEGKTVVKKLNSLATQILQEVVKGYSEAEVILLKRLLNHLIDNLK